MVSVMTTLLSLRYLVRLSGSAVAGQGRWARTWQTCGPNRIRRRPGVSEGTEFRSGREQLWTRCPVSPGPAWLTASHRVRCRLGPTRPSCG